ncbi:MAG: PaaI family thioesterase [bacterium]|nr:PaaI family thioesterase [bacterium]
MIKEMQMNSENFHPFAALIGLKFTACENGESSCTLEVTDQLLNPHKVLHGGVIYSMADTGMGGALYTKLNKGELCATVEIKINYFEAVYSGTLICNTRLIHKGKRTAVLESEIKNNDKLVSKALGTYSLFDANLK